MVYTSVIIVLPLGTLVAQRIADPAAFSNGELSNGNTRMGNHIDDRFGKFTATNGTKANHLLSSPNWSQSDKDSSHGMYGGKHGVTATVTVGTPNAKNSNAMYHAKTGQPMSAVDIELARIDADLEAGVVRVDREIQQDEEVL